MTVLRESPWYQQIVGEGQLALILQQLKTKLGDLPLDLEVKIQSLPPDKITALGQALLNFSKPSELQDWLEHGS